MLADDYRGAGVKETKRLEMSVISLEDRALI